MGTERFDKAAGQWDAKPRRVELASIITGAICSAVPLTRNMTGLEYGCGTGLVTFEVAKQVELMYGLDSSPGMIGVLEEKSRALGVTNVIPFPHEITDLDIPGLDFVLISMTLHHIRHHIALLDDCYRALRSGGFLAIADLEAEDGSFHKDNDGIFHFGFDTSTLRQDVQEIGFGKAETKIIHRMARNDQEYPIFLLTAQKA